LALPFVERTGEAIANPVAATGKGDRPPALLRRPIGGRAKGD